MDSRGAQELARLIDERRPERPVLPLPVVKARAAPIFHWLGIEPPPLQPSTEAE